jgi:hypothetical protein
MWSSSFGVVWETDNLSRKKLACYEILHWAWTCYINKVWGCIQKFPDWVDNEISNNNKHSLRNLVTVLTELTRLNKSYKNIREEPPSLLSSGYQGLFPWR